MIAIATPADIPALCGLLSDLFAQESEFQPDPEAQQMGLSAILHDAAVGHVIVARNPAGEVIGMLSLLYTMSTALGGRVALLEDMVIQAAHRNQGVGSALLHYAIAMAQEQQIRRITLLTDADNSAAQRFYRRQGFQPSPMHPWRLLLTTAPAA
ncbi:GNAT family N-acetyltransferase [Methylophilus aquaticus]|uniref:GNAT family N-acetyltransferase n=2 Tax=Methylophilus aquaticus TaxID=1971610 RepID=A0ABT9JQI2_9PROT|nr:GNAT family N-acetyltransferase [Methylophilus aquaticus]